MKEDLHASTSELVYGTTLCLPGQFFAPSLDKEVTDPASYVSRLRTHMQQVRPTPTSHHVRIKPHVSSTLNTCTHVFVRRDALRKALQPTYDGPFNIIIRRASKFFTVLVHGQEQTISLDRLKAAHLDIAEDVLPSSTSTPSSTATSASTTATPASTSVTPQVPVRTTCSGRRVHFPERNTS